MMKALQVAGLAVLVAFAAVSAATAAPEHARAPSSPVAACARDVLIVRAATDRESYRRGQLVLITVRVRNASRKTCTVATGSCLPQVLVTNQVGAVVWNRAATQVVCTVRTGHRLAAGAEVAQVVSWNGEACVGRDPNSCPGRFVRAGRYRADASWSSRSRGSVHFVVNA